MRIEFLPRFKQFPDTLTIVKPMRFYCCKEKSLLVVLFCSGLAIMSGCADIRLKPRDAETMAMGKFAERVTEHLFEKNPNTYKEYQTLLEQDLAPNVLAQLKMHDTIAKSADEADQTAQDMQTNSKRCLIQVESTSFPSKATAQGLVPIEVTGTAVKTKDYISKTSKFDIYYLIGTNVKTRRPIVASVEIKQF